MVLRIFQLVLFLIFYHLSCGSRSCFQYYKTSRETCTGWWDWGGCGTIYTMHSKCCDRYSNTWFGRNVGTCNTPRCHWRYSDNSCNVYEGYVKHKDGTVVRNSGGYCDTPEVCKGCNKGYYPTRSNDGYCKVVLGLFYVVQAKHSECNSYIKIESKYIATQHACPSPDHCNLPVCSNSHDTTCEYCEGEFIRERPGYNIYTGKPDNKRCQKACSWSVGARCFPGTCGGDMILAKDCKCAKGFSGDDCAAATTEVMPTIKDMSLTFNESGHKLIVDKALGNIFWTKTLTWSELEVVVSSNYKALIEGVQPNYVTHYLIGVEEMQIHLKLTRGSDRSTWTIDGGCTNFKENCDYTLTKPIKRILPWQKIFNGNFRHGDRIEFSVSSTNGGKVFYQYRSVKPYLEKWYMLRGVTTTQTLVLGFDEQQPEHCYEQSNDCTKDSLSAEDFLRKPQVFVQWDGWTDRDSGIDKYEFDIYYLKMKTTGGPLTDDKLLPTVSLSSRNSSALLNLTDPGPYSIEIIVHDLAGNHKTSRRIILFDNESVVDLRGNRSKIIQSNDNGWINTYSKEIEVVWTGRFRNIRHSNGGWLNAVQAKEDIQRDLDDRKGRSERTVEKTDNIEGIVQFDIANLIELNGHSTFSDYITVPDKYFHSEKMIYNNVDFEDGKKLTYFVRGVDAVGEYAEDNVTAMIDLSPPIIQNLWLTKGALVNISVHSVLELKDLTIEWEAFDYHSGLHEVHWKLFDNYTKNVVVHGQSHEPPQGETETLDECKNKYEKYPRGSSCYCSPYNGCFHKHYQIKPAVIHDNSSGGLLFGKEIGEHDYDYYIEVTVINNAGLTSVRHKKITIDTSPPHEGTVHDGIPGDPEVDFQQSLQLSGHWDGFFDKESSVWFYAYGFSERCLDEHDLDIHTPTKMKVNWTYDSWVESSASKPGKYFLTVIAYNHALGHSKPVCSDGVTINTVPAVVSEVVVKDAVTPTGLVKSDVNDKVFILHRNRELEEVKFPPTLCRDRATLLSQSVLELYPQKRYRNGSMSLVKINGDCNNLNGVHPDLISYITSDSKVDISWNVTYGEGNVYDYEVGIASENSIFPDVMDFTSSHHHQHMRLFHPDIFDGEHFYIMLKAVTKSSVTDIKVVGPFLYDSTKPDFTGNISISIEHVKDNTFLIARWGENAFTDHGDPNALSYEAAIGSTRNGKDILPFQKISVGGSCTSLKPATCTAFSVHFLPWHLHGEQDYFVTIKVKDTVGQYVTASSEEYRHNIELASQGIVHDIDGSTQQMGDIEDIDFQVGLSTLSVHWSGFEHPHEDITFTVCISLTTSQDDYMICEHSDTSNKHTFRNISLVSYKRYYQTVIAETEAGNVTATSDGVIVVVDGDVIKGIKVFDGAVCNGSLNEDLNLTTSHHDEDKRLQCQEDIDFQASTNSLRAHWAIPDEKRLYVNDIYWAIDERAPVADIWKAHTDYQHLKIPASYMEESGLSLTPGRSYRISLKFCARQYCFKPVHSDGVTVVPNPPSTGKVSVNYNKNETEIVVTLETFRDSDIEDLTQSRESMDHYEWAFADDSALGRLLTKWQHITHSGSLMDNQLNFTIHLEDTISFTKCWVLAVRGYTKAGLSSTVSTEIKACNDLEQVRPSVVIDAIGDPVSTEDDHIGKEIFLAENDIWKEADKDYTPYNNILSAVWPTLRHGQYSWAVLLMKDEDPTVFYDRSSRLDLSDPCEHPDAIKCGNTDQEFINVHFNPGELDHGTRYIICIHANKTELQHEFWSQDLEEINECSSGITVDLTPPVEAEVWIGNEKDYLFQTSTSELTVHWNSFTDVEEEGNAAHTSGVTHYEVALGTTAGGIDIQPFTDVGLTNHKTFHNLKLQNGHTYFATVIAYDFTGQFSSSKSEGIKVDTTPPQLTNASITLPSRQISDTEFVEACWTGVFVDVESGISKFSWAVGTHAGYDDIFPFTDTDEDCAKTPENIPLKLKEGHAYFVTAKAHNNAGLYTASSSWAFVVEATPPIAGKVYDGPPGLDGSCVDVDYVEDHSTLQAHWKGFHDPHSTLVEYFVHIGSCKNCEDVLVKQPVGITTDVEFTFLQLSQGIHYYVTVTACNTANLCTSVSSDGFVVDSTPPLKGTVTDGPLEIDVQYQASDNYLGCEWDSFTDPQSGISHYVWRVGTTKGGDNILAATEAHKHEEAFVFDYYSEYGTYLPKSVRLYCTVRAYNKAGKFTEASSNGFIIDETKPVFSTALSMSPIGTKMNGTTVLRSTLKVYWEVQDEESFIETQHLSISSHIGGDFNLSSTRVEGIVRDYTFTDLDFHDGSYYCIKLISCNGANLCIMSVLKDILVDSTKPTPGTFAINTDHAAALDRQPDDWMTWTTISISLAWLGFEDVHSSIDEYTINIGSHFMGSDLNEIPNISMVVKHNSNATFHEDGMVQTFKFRTQKLGENKTVFISVTATNYVGLSSPVVHSQFNLLFGGIMELVRRCDTYSCLGHCVCAPQGKLCHSIKGCNDKCEKSDSETISTMMIEVNDYLDLRFPESYNHPYHSPVNTMLAAKWTLSSSAGDRPVWYEWSVGESLYEYPQGVFDETNEKSWHESGSDMYCVFTVDRGRMVLEEHKTYSVFVRAWYNRDTCKIFKSKGVTIFHTAPLSITINGRSVKEVAKGSKKDLDFITRSTEIYADWSGKFGGNISKYHVYISTHPGGHDLHTVSKDLSSSVTAVNLTGLKYEENTKYFTVVQAYNLAGLHKTEVSDGFVLDLEPPTPGIVFDGLVLTDKHASNDTTSIESYWHGFSDVGSGIKAYEFCVSSGTIKGACDIKPLSPLGIGTRIKYFPNTQLEQGGFVRGEVRARDVIGLVSPLVSSNGVIIDTTAPVRSKSIECNQNIIKDSSFEDIMHEEDKFSICHNMSESFWNTSSNGCVSLVDSNMAQHGKTKLHLRGSISQTVDTVMHGKYRLTFYTSTIPSDNLHLSAIEGYTEINGERHVFLMYSKPNTKTYAWQKHVFFFHLDTNVSLVTFGTVKNNVAFAVDGIRFQLCEVSTTETQEAVGHVNSHTVFVHDWSSIHADWSFTDPETDILEYLWAIGTVIGGTQLQTFVSVGRRTFASNSSLRLEHGTSVYITVVAINAAGLRTASYSDPILIDLTRPECKYVNDGPVLGQDFDFVRGSRLDAHWDISDAESGLKECSWALGTSRGDSSVQDFVMVNPRRTNATKLFTNIPKEKIYFTIRCTNGAGLTHTCSSDGVTLIENPPSVDDVIVELLTTSATQYEPRGHYHGNVTEIKFRWTGFRSDEGVQNYLIALDGHSIAASEIVESSSSGYSYASFTGLTLEDGNYTVSVTGINEVKMYSQKRSVSFTLVTQPPTLTGSQMKTTWTKSSSVARADWKGMFTSKDPMYYEVSARLAEGGEGDLIQWQETVDTEIEIVLDTKEIPTSGVNVRFSNTEGDGDKEARYIVLLTRLPNQVFSCGGTVIGGTQLQTFVSVGRRTFASNSSLRLEHGTSVHITVVAINAAGLRTASYSDPILIDLTRPECKYVNDGPVLGQDFDFVRGSRLDAHWDISDAESGLKECSWALGTSRGDSSVQDFVMVNPRRTNATKLFTNIPKEKIYFTIRCTNGAGQTHTCSSDGVTLIENPPSVDDVIVELLTTSATQYEPRGHYHGNMTEIKFRWTGFRSDEGVQNYLIALDGHSIAASEIVESSSSGYSYASFTGLTLEDGNYTVSVTGINDVKMYSQKRSVSFTLVTQPPTLTGSQLKTTWTKSSSVARADWKGMFTSKDPTYYEVSARLAEGGEGDLIQWQETVDTEIEIVLDTKEIPTSGVNVRFSNTEGDGDKEARYIVLLTRLPNQVFSCGGTVIGGSQLQTFVSVGRRTFASNSSLRLEHGTPVYITVVAINAAGLRTASYSDPILIDLTRPECKYVNDGPVLVRCKECTSCSIVTMNYIGHSAKLPCPLAVRSQFPVDYTRGKCQLAANFTL